MKSLKAGPGQFNPGHGRRADRSQCAAGRRTVRKEAREQSGRGRQHCPGEPDLPPDAGRAARREDGCRGFEVAAQDRQYRRPGLFGFWRRPCSRPAAARPIYHLYQDALGLSPDADRDLRGLCDQCLLRALLTVGGLSDHVGRRPVIFAALMLNAAALVLFLWAETAAMLIAARCAFRNGGRVSHGRRWAPAILDSDRAQGPLRTASPPLSGSPPARSAQARWWPSPGSDAAGLRAAARGDAGAGGADRRCRKPPPASPARWPRSGPICVPARARPALLGIAPVNVAGWALGGFFLADAEPRARRDRAAIALHRRVVVAVTALTATLAVTGCEVGAERLLRICAYALVARRLDHARGRRVASRGADAARRGGGGIGFGTVLSGTMRTLLPARRGA